MKGQGCGSKVKLGRFQHPEREGDGEGVPPRMWATLQGLKDIEHFSLT